MPNLQLAETYPRVSPMDIDILEERLKSMVDVNPDEVPELCAGDLFPILQDFRDAQRAISALAMTVGSLETENMRLKKMPRFIALPDTIDVLEKASQIYKQIDERLSVLQDALR